MASPGTRRRGSGLPAALAALLLAAGCATTTTARPAAPAAAAADTFAEQVRGLEKRSGLLDFWVDPKRGRVLLELPAPSSDRGEVGTYLYVEGLVTGLGSNPVGLDRGQLGPARLVVLRRLGGRLLVEEQNPAFRALTPDPAERRAARQSFATSVLWAGELLATAADGRALVDWTPFLVRDAHRVVARLRDTGQGVFKLDPARSAVDLEACLAFPDNLEFEALLTYASEAAGDEVRATAPSPDELSLVQHHSLVRLPAAGYRPRAFDPRAGSFAIGFHDYAAPLDAPLERRWIVRHRLGGDGERPPTLTYYVDRGIPEPVRSAVLEGAGWWTEAFAAAGFPDAFRVELLPEDAHPLDVRYNVIQWVHRATRGWSYGGGVIDPRTGEMVKGHVSLGSLRVRHDRILFEGLVGADRTGTGASDDPIQVALARIRQLAAHEVGHTLGLAHNFAASTYGRASVMDYPAPLVRIRDGGLDLSDAYAVGIGAWDAHAVRYAYELHPEDGEAVALEELIEDGLERGLVMLTDADARPAGASMPRASLWDNGDDPVAQLELDLAVRRHALTRFGEDRVSPGQPLALLEEVLAPLYFRHRYQLRAAVKAVGGLEYRYTVRGGLQPWPAPIAAGTQRRALDAVLGAVDPAELDLPETVLAVLHPRPFEYRPNRELFRGRTAPAFDPLEAAAVAAGLVLSDLLEPARAARLVDFHRRDPQLPSLEEVLDRIKERVFARPDGETVRRAEVRRAVERVAVGRLVGLAADDGASPAVRARVEERLGALVGELGAAAPAGAERAHRQFLKREIERYLGRAAAPVARQAAANDPPPGDPIGSWLPDEDPGCSWHPGPDLGFGNR